MKRFVAGVATVGVLFGAGYGVARVGGQSRSAEALKIPAAAAASIPGMRYSMGNVVIAGAAGSTGIAVAAYSVARCSRGKRAIAGGWSSGDNTNDPVTISSSVPTKNGGWLVVAEDVSRDDTSPGFTFQAVAWCA